MFSLLETLKQQVKIIVGVRDAEPSSLLNFQHTSSLFSVNVSRVMPHASDNQVCKTAFAGCEIYRIIKETNDE